MVFDKKSIPHFRRVQSMKKINLSSLELENLISPKMSPGVPNKNTNRSKRIKNSRP